MSTQPASPQDGVRDLALAWTALALAPLLYLAANVLAEVGGSDWPGALGWVLMFGCGAAAVVLGLRARSRGRSAGVLPAAIAAVVIGSQALLLLVGVIAHFVLGIE